MQSAELIPRHARAPVVTALKDTRVVYISGARQVGKSTLAQQIARTDHPALELSLDDSDTRERANGDPEGFVAGLGDRPAMIDEVQRAPALLLAIKRAVDRDTSPGRFLLTGSADLLSSRWVLDSLTGRVEIVRLWPLAQSEIRGTRSNFVDTLFAGGPPWVEGATAGRDAFVEICARGGFPEARLRDGPRRDDWFASYLLTLLERDLAELSNARRLSEMPRLLRALAAQSSNLLSFRGIADRLDLGHESVRDYVSVLQAICLVQVLPAWRAGLTTREVKRPKAHLIDSGLLAHLLNAGETRIANDDQVTGRVLESFAVTEIVKHLDWASTRARAHHYRQRDEEIDLILEDGAGRIVAVEIKASVSVGERDTTVMAKLRDARKGAFVAGVVLCAREDTIPLGDRLWAVPLSGLWA